MFIGDNMMATIACIALLFNGLQVASSFMSHGLHKKYIVTQQIPHRKRSKYYSSNIECFQTSDATAENGSNGYFRQLLFQFQGDFDNYNQVLRDRKHGLAPAEGGGHEHIHCTLVPCPQSTDATKHYNDQWILAAFYFNGNPRQIFRFRMYKLISPKKDGMDGEKVRMKLHTLRTSLEQQLRQYSDQPCTWWRETYAVWLNSTNAEDIESDDTMHNKWNTFQAEGIEGLVSPLLGCDVLWDPQWDPEKHAYLNVDEYSESESSSTKMSEYNDNNDGGCHATMEAGPKGAIVDSISMIPGKRILIKDELSLWEDNFWINDRGYDPDAAVEDDGAKNDDNVDGVGNMPFVYGNQRGVPYKLERVSCIAVKDSNNGSADMTPTTLMLERSVSEQELAWTLGEDYREQIEYEEKLRAVEDALLRSQVS